MVKGILSVLILVDVFSSITSENCLYVRGISRVNIYPFLSCLKAYLRLVKSLYKFINILVRVQM